MTAGQETVETRDEDAFDVGALHVWLSANAPAMDVAGLDAPTVEQFPGGASNLTYLLRYSDPDGEREFVMRRPPSGHKAASAHDMRREVEVQTRLRPHYPLVPEVMAFCQDQSVIGSDFYVMERLDGTILRAKVPAGIELGPARAHELANTVIDAQADLHMLDPEAVGLMQLGRGLGYVRRQVEGWSRRYRASWTDDVPEGSEVMAWLDANQPPDVAQRVIHGDWRFDNLVLDLAEPPRIVGVLDWEMSTVGDPLMDLGSSLAYWVTADDDEAFQLTRRQPSYLPGMPTRDQYVERYLTRTGLAVDDFRFYEVFGLFRLAVIIEQIWFRYRRGDTHNPAFAGFGAATTTLMDRATARAV